MGTHDFGITPTWVYPVEEKYNVIKTESENYKKEYYLLSTTPNIQYQLVFNGITDSTFASIQTHYRSVSGEYALFDWNSVPSYINGGGGLGTTMQGRWVEKPDWSPDSKSWNVKMLFEKDVQ